MYSQNKMEASKEIKKLKDQIKKCKGDLNYNLTNNERKGIKEHMNKCIEKKKKLEEKYFPTPIPSWMFRRYKNINEEKMHL